MIRCSNTPTRSSHDKFFCVFSFAFFLREDSRDVLSLQKLNGPPGNETLDFLRGVTRSRGNGCVFRGVEQHFCKRGPERSASFYLWVKPSDRLLKTGFKKKKSLIRSRGARGHGTVNTVFCTLQLLIEYYEQIWTGRWKYIYHYKLWLVFLDMNHSEKDPQRFVLRVK